MARIYLRLGFIALLISELSTFYPLHLHAQTSQEDSLVQFTGYILNTETKEPISGRITYEKLPNGDDYGISTADSMGKFDLVLLLNKNYSFTIKADGFNTLKGVFFINGVSLKDSGESIRKDFFLTPGGIGQIIRLKSLHFDQSTSEIPAYAFKEIDMVVKMLKENPKMVIQLEGHTDFRGNSKLNYKLSEKRVEAIKDYIYTQGIDKKRIKLKAFGGSAPLSKENTNEAKKANRRVEVRVLSI